MYKQERDFFIFYFLLQLLSFVLTLSGYSYLPTIKGLKPCTYKAPLPNQLPFVVLLLTSRLLPPPPSPLLKISSFSSQFTPLLYPSHIFLTVPSRQNSTKRTNARNSNGTYMSIAYLKYRVVVKALNSSSVNSREPMFPLYNVLITGSTKVSLFSFFSG